MREDNVSRTIRLDIDWVSSECMSGAEILHCIETVDRTENRTSKMASWQRLKTSCAWQRASRWNG